MTKNIEPRLKKIGDYLKLENKESYFVIPEYQRGYSWTIAHCDKLWQDIENFIDSKGKDPYFFGIIIVDYSSENEPNLIDGQQRTTTFILLLKALLIKINDSIKNISDTDEDSESLKDGLEERRNKILTILYKVDAEDRAKILKNPEEMKNSVIVENRSINEIYPDEIKKIVGAKNYDEAEFSVHKIPRRLRDNKYTNQFKNFKFFYEKLKSKSDSQINEFAKTALENCEVIEIRSWQIEQAITTFNSLNSTGLPLSDADIISAQLYSKATDKNEFNKKWKEIIELSQKLDEAKIVDIDQILNEYMYILRAKAEPNDGGYRNGDNEVPGLRRYYIDIKKDLLNDPLNFADDMKKLLDIWDTIKEYPTVKLTLKFNENIKLYLAAFFFRYSKNEITEEKIATVCDCLVRLFAVLELVDAGYSSKHFRTFLFNEIKKFVNNDITEEEIVADFNNHIQAAWNIEDIKSEIKEYDKNILVFLNEYLYSKEKDKVLDLSGSINIEHIMPASGKNIATIRKDAGLSKEEFDEIVNSLGNKILLEEDINKSIGNEWFKTKKQSSVKEKSGYKDSKFPLALALIGYPKDKWEKEDIETANSKIADRLAKFIFNKDDQCLTKTKSNK